MDKTKFKVCLADFGLSCSAYDAEKFKEKCGTPGYIDPAIL